LGIDGRRILGGKGEIESGGGRSMRIADQRKYIWHILHKNDFGAGARIHKSNNAGQK
jgi:hypothetical protein